jgi:DNA-binding NarL/FixJ family response regulator
LTYNRTKNSTAKIFISGPNLLQNTLLAECLIKELQVECACHPNLTLMDMVEKEPDRTCVCLFDCFYSTTEEIDKRLNNGVQMNSDNVLPVLFNVNTDSRIEKMVRQKSIRGIFYQNDSHRVFIKGIRTILRGELWFTRKMLSRCILHPRTNKNARRLCIPLLSQRENEVLRLLATGAGNQDIAEEMCISLNTVKTHLYNIYRKIGVPNRLQATLWAANFTVE